MAHHPFLTALRIELRPLVPGTDAEPVRDFCELLRREPRYFGPGADPKVPALSPARLLHPAGPTCAGAFLGDTLVGLARLEPRRTAEAGARLTVVVRPPWRRSGVGTKLVRAVSHDESARPMETAIIDVAKNNRAALALGRACGMDRTEVAPDRIRLTLQLGAPTARVA